MKPAKIRAARVNAARLAAHYLNGRKDSVSKWERGEKRLDGRSLKLLNLVKAKGLKAIA